MKYIILAGSMVLALFTTSGATAFDGHPLGDTKEKHCYALGMIAFDSVINARLGVFPEHALNLSSRPPPPGMTQKTYYQVVLNTVLDAYLWHDTPHAYALKVFYACAIMNGADR